jgi:methylthioribose-1-phosphate isomerase
LLFLKGEKIIKPLKADVIKTWFWTDSALYLLDQRKLPLEEKYIKCNTILKVRDAIKNMVVRGAPAIGIVSAIGFVIGFKSWLNNKKEVNKKRVEEILGKFSNLLCTARPTAVNLSWAVERVRKKALSFLQNCNSVIRKDELIELYKTLKNEALKIWEEDIEANLRMAEFGKDIISAKGILTHCNTGALATGGYGTALGVIRKLYKNNRKIKIFVDETRPYLQGARLTAWELTKLKIPFYLITDNSAGFLMKKGLVEAVIVGADRIVRNGDTANKIGTYSLAVLAKTHKIPFFVVAPSSTFDLNLKTGNEIPIEERSEEEVKTCFKNKIAPEKARAYNYAFDITPGELITGIITERGVIYPPYKQNIARVIGRS